VVNLQLRLMSVAGDAQTLGAAMNHSSLNIGNAMGAWLGGLVIAAGWGYRAPALVGVLLAVAGVGILLLSARQDAGSGQVPPRRSGSGITSKSDVRT
jgi:MFS transporter, DHA1 family, inner membrane transport protein